MSNVATTDFRSGQAIPLDAISEGHRQLFDPARPDALRQRVARGLLPASFEDLVPTLAKLTQDSDQTTATAARKTLSEMSDEQLGPVLSGLKDPHLLDTLARVLMGRPNMQRLIVVSRHTDDQTIAKLAATANRDVANAIAAAQVRALRTPAIIEALFFNPKAPHGAVNSLMELAIREGLELDHMPGYRELRLSILGENRLKELTGATAVDEDAGLAELDFMSAVDLALEDPSPAEGEEEEDEGRKTLHAMVREMNVAQKIRLALIGDANARKLLIRDPKKMVALAVLKSPRLSDKEIAGFATNRALNEDVVSTIARNRQWTKEYAVRKALILNPKTKMTIAMGFLRTMSKKDLKAISKDRNCSGAVARAAKRMLVKLEQGNRKKK